MNSEDNDVDVLFSASDRQWLSSHGAYGLIYREEVKDMKRASARIFRLLLDREWHSAEEIRLVAGRDGIPASEGLRRLRDLRVPLQDHALEIELRRANNSKMFFYRLRPQQLV